MKVYINGRFLTQKITGVQRYAIEIIKELDKINSNIEFVLLCPKQTKMNDLSLKNIKVLQIGKFSGHLWEQISLPFYILKTRKKSILLNLCNLAPVLYPGYTVIHDISFKTNSEHLNWKFSYWYKIITKLNIKRYKHIFTVSNFSKKEILDNYKVVSDKITITYNSADHLDLTSTNNEILKKYDLINKKFYFSLGSNSKHKNFKYIFELAKKYPNKIFVVTGNNNSKVFNNSNNLELCNLIYTGYLNDSELVSLYSNCEAFIFPSLYEGFGIPPLEAVKMGCKHLILSDIDVLHEIYGDDANYVDTLNNFEIPKKLIKANSKKMLAKYSWRNSAEVIIQKLDN